jgi:hypothetical protein
MVEKIEWACEVETGVMRNMKWSRLANRRYICMKFVEVVGNLFVWERTKDRQWRCIGYPPLSKWGTDFIVTYYFPLKALICTGIFGSAELRMGRDCLTGICFVIPRFAMWSCYHIVCVISAFGGKQSPCVRDSSGTKRNGALVCEEKSKEKNVEWNGMQSHQDGEEKHQRRKVGK